ncbi:hypothetical protein F511_34389 [Dorcoceras hygrometricum]|uniref:Uncharacterized protein n=1 Tax=Dorcoceras hygrometricum TaxID=472368 RepID=A0A2Z7AFP9_9LAMI|nr:hypothetical protein F511_34389 [Dorcoceras hygrometricum]
MMTSAVTSAISRKLQRKPAVGTGRTSYWTVKPALTNKEFSSWTFSKENPTADDLAKQFQQQRFSSNDQAVTAQQRCKISNNANLAEATSSSPRKTGARLRKNSCNRFTARLHSNSRIRATRLHTRFLTRAKHLHALGRPDFRLRSVHVKPDFELVSGRDTDHVDGGTRRRHGATQGGARRRKAATCVTLNGSGIQLAVGPQPLRLRNQNFGLAHRIMVKRLAKSPHDPLGITDSSCKNRLVVVSVQYGPFNTYIPIRSTTIGKSRVAKDPITTHTSWRLNSDIASVTSWLKSRLVKDKVKSGSKSSVLNQQRRGSMKAKSVWVKFLPQRDLNGQSVKPKLNRSHNVSARTLVDIHTGKTIKDNRYKASQESIIWYLDSGCARHMTGNPKLLSDVMQYK